MAHDEFEHNPGDHDDPLAGPTWTVGIIGLILMAVSVLGVAAIYYQTRTEQNAKKVLEVPVIAIAELRERELARLYGGATIEWGVLPPVRVESRLAGGQEAEDSVVISIDRAMEALVAEGGGGS